MIHPYQIPPHISTSRIRGLKSVVTFIIPVFNQEDIIINTLIGLFASASLPFDLIIIDDGSVDSSLMAIEHFLDTYDINLLQSYTLIHNPVPLFETACDNQGFRQAKTEYIIEVQADVKISEAYFDVKMIDLAHKDMVGTVSGRLIHPFSLLDGNASWRKYPLHKLKTFKDPYYQCAGLMDKTIFSGIPINTILSSCYVGETNARGPWLIRKSHLERLGYLDEANFFLGNDDHDFNRRLYQQLGLIAGYVPVCQSTKHEYGSTRKKRFGKNLEIFKYLSNNKKGSTGFMQFMAEYKPYYATLVLE
jgi:GT2 family glycosyltransferase